MKHTPVAVNQHEIDSWDQLNWRAERDRIYQTIKSWAKQNNIGLDTNSREFVDIDSFLKSPNEKIIYAQLFDPVPYFSMWKELSDRCKNLGKKIFVITDNIIDFEPLENVKFFSKSEYLGVTASYGDQYLKDVEKKKLFNCFIQRVDSVRQSWFYFLKNKNLLDLGHVSFLLKQMSTYAGSRVGVELYNHIHQEFQLYNLPHFEQAYQELKNQIPYRNFKEEHNLLPLISESKYSLVLETCAVEDDIGLWCWTEKSLRDLQFPVITLPFWQKRSAEKLNNLGFDLPKYLWDFDNDPWQIRQQKLLHLLENDSIIYNYSECLDRAVHNRSLLSAWKNTYQQSGFLDSVYEEILST